MLFSWDLEIFVTKNPPAERERDPFSNASTAVSYTVYHGMSYTVQPYTIQQTKKYHCMTWYDRSADHKTVTDHKTLVAFGRTWHKLSFHKINVVKYKYAPHIYNNCNSLPARPS